MTEPEVIIPDWSAPPAVRAAVSTRRGGVSRGPYASLNLGLCGGDDPASVAENRRLLSAGLRLPAEPAWLRQVHGNRVVEIDGAGSAATPEADAAWTRRAGVVLAILTADCLPVLLCERRGTRVAAVHCGWRGLASGVLARTVDALGEEPARLQAWLGPAIGRDHFEIGPEVREALLDRGRAPESAFRDSHRDGHWMCDLYAVARYQLAASGLSGTGGGGFCTYADPERFYSYRRDGRTGRMVSLIWISRSPGERFR